MGTDFLLSVYLVMLFFQTLYILEEVRNGAYEEMGSLNTYLLATAFLLLLYYLPLLLIVFGMNWGVYVGFLPAVLSIGNGGAHIFRLIKDKSLRSSLAIGIALGLALTVSGILAFLGLLANM